MAAIIGIDGISSQYAATIAQTMTSDSAPDVRARAEEVISDSAGATSTDSTREKLFSRERAAARARELGNAPDQNVTDVVSYERPSCVVNFENGKLVVKVVGSGGISYERYERVSGESGYLMEREFLAADGVFHKTVLWVEQDEIPQHLRGHFDTWTESINQRNFNHSKFGSH